MGRIFASEISHELSIKFIDALKNNDGVMSIRMADIPRRIFLQSERE